MSRHETRHPRRFGLRLGALLGLGFGLGLTAAVAATTALTPRDAWAGPCRPGEIAEEVEVKSGDSFSRIGSRHGVGYAVVERSNPGVDPRSIRPGQKIRVCVEGEGGGSGSSGASKRSSSTRRSCGGGRYITEHTVESGDTISELATQYGSSEAAILKRNASLGGDASHIRVGQVLDICGDAGGEHSGIGGRTSGKKSKTCGGRTPVWIHEVVPGEIASSVAARYGVRRRDLYRLNGALKDNPNSIHPGQEIRVCPEIAPRKRERIIHTVSSGETFSGIAQDYGVTSRQLEAFQRGKLSSRSNLRVGQELVVYKDGGVVPGFGAIDDDTGSLQGGTMLTAGSYYTTKAGSLSWGTAKTIRLIQSAISRYRQRSGGGPKVHVGDISRRGGGSFPPHKSHQHGRDVDIAYVLTGDSEQNFRRVSASNLDAKRTYRLVQAFIDSNEVRYIFMDYYIQEMLYDYGKSHGVSEDTLEELFQYPRGKRAGAGIIRHSKGHDDHFHVRFRG